MTTIARDPLGTDRVPVGPGLSMFDPMFIGIDEFGQHVTLETASQNPLTARAPGGGNPGLSTPPAPPAGLADNSRLVLLDGKWVELGPWLEIADAFVGNDIDAALSVLKRLLTVATNRYRWLLA